jgi:hypothetical protein
MSGSFLQMSDGCGHGYGDSIEPISLGEQFGVVTVQGLDWISFGIHDAPNRRQVEADRSQQQDLLKTQQLFVLVVAVTIATDPGRPQQADLVVVPQRSCRHPRGAGHLLNRPTHRQLPSCRIGANARSCRHGKVNPHRRL